MTDRRKPGHPPADKQAGAGKASARAEKPAASGKATSKLQQSDQGDEEHAEQGKILTNTTKKKGGIPPIKHRFKKGESGNPKGRPKSKPAITRSAYDILLENIEVISPDGTTLKLPSEDVLALKTFNAAMAGRPAAMRRLSRMIQKREAWLNARAVKLRPPLKLLTEPASPDNADEALLLLDIAQVESRRLEERAKDQRSGAGNAPRRRLKLKTWAVHAALSRSGRRLSKDDVTAIKLFSENPQGIRWPKSVRDDENE